MDWPAVQVPRKIRDVVVGAAIAAVLIGVIPDDSGTQSGGPEARQLALPVPRLPQRSRQRCKPDRPDRCKPINFGPSRFRHAGILTAIALAEYAETERRLRAFLAPHALDMRI